jgi:predicted transcriptional regulator of viral defense system/very-short-patch-repair endonuclease
MQGCTSIDGLIARTAREQLGLFTKEQALHAGVTDLTITQRCARGRWERVRPGVYRVAGTPSSWEHELLAACLATSSTAVASHRAAAALWELPGVERGRLEVMVDRERWHRLAGVTCHQSIDLSSEDRALRGGIPVTRIERTLFDMARFFTIARLEEAVDEALRRGLTTVEQMNERFDEFARPGRRGLKRIRAVLSMRDPVAALPESVQERRLARLLQRHGLPLPVLQFEIRVGGRLAARVDAAYPEHRIAIEYDSYMFHGGRRRHELDLARRNRLEALGWRVLHATAADIRNADELCRAVRAALALTDDTLCG